MRGIICIILVLSLTACESNELSWISIRNATTSPIFVLPYSSDFTNSEWIQPGVSDEFYSINCDCLDGYGYFSFYYDSLIIMLADQEENPIKFYKDGTTINYDPDLNPFTNPDVWKVQDFDRHVSGSSVNTLEEKHIYEHYFTIETQNVRSLCMEEESESESAL